MCKRKYKIVEENRPSDSFIRWIPKSMDIKKDEYGMECKTEWETISWFSVECGYVKTKKEAESLIDRYENHILEDEGHFIINETEYKPKQI